MSILLSIGIGTTVLSCQTQLWIEPKQSRNISLADNQNCKTSAGELWAMIDNLSHFIHSIVIFTRTVVKVQIQTVRGLWLWAIFGPTFHTPLNSYKNLSRFIISPSPSSMQIVGPMYAYGIYLISYAGIWSWQVIVIRWIIHTWNR